MRGRLLTVPLLLVAAVAVAIAVTVLRPVLAGVGTGTGPRLLGLLIAFWVLWLGAAALLCLVYRLFASTPVRVGPLVTASLVTGSWLAGQTLGYVLTIRLVSGFDRAYAGVAGIGAVAAVAFLLYLNHVVTLLGYLLALQLHESGVRWRPRTTRADGPGSRCRTPPESSGLQSVPAAQATGPSPSLKSGLGPAGGDGSLGARRSPARVAAPSAGAPPTGCLDGSGGAATARGAPRPAAARGCAPPGSRREGTR